MVAASLLNLHLLASHLNLWKYVANDSLSVFHKYVKLTLKKLCENDPANWDKYIN